LRGHGPFGRERGGVSVGVGGREFDPVTCSEIGANTAGGSGVSVGSNQ
jgi:hypothetical protein